MIFISFSIERNTIPCSTVPTLSHLSSRTPTKSNLYLTNSLSTVVSDPDLYKLLTFQVPNVMSFFRCLGCSKGINPCPRQMYPYLNKASFYGEELLAPHPTSTLEDHTLSAVSDCLFNTFTATLHIGSCSSIRNLRTSHAMVTGTHLSCTATIAGKLVSILIFFYLHSFWSPKTLLKFKISISL